MPTGTVSNVIINRGYGWITTPGKPDTFFHCSALESLPFDEQLRGRRVLFETVTDQRTGRDKAAFVRPSR